MAELSHPRARSAVLTGASRGLGMALARGMAARGWRLVIDGRDAATLRAVEHDLASITDVVAVPGDIGDRAHRAQLGAAARRLGGLDGVVHNAAALGPVPLRPLLDLPLAGLRDVLEINVVAQLGLMQELARLVRPGGCIVTVSSDAAIESYPGWGAYGASKAALERLSGVLAAELPSVRVCCVDPGEMQTAMHRAAVGDNQGDPRPPEQAVPALLHLLECDARSGRYVATELVPAAC